MDVRDERLAEYADRQHGCFSDDQAHAVGFPARTVRYRVTAGMWARLGPNSLRHGHAPETWRMRLRAGLLDLGDEALVGRRAAAALLGLDGFEPGPVEFTVPRRLRNRTTAGVVHSAVSMPLIDRCTVAGFPVTSASRVAIELANEMSELALENLVDSAVRLGWSSPAFLGKRLTELRGPGRRGVRLLDRVLLDSGGHSMLERRFLKLVRLAGLERPLVQVVHSADGRFIARVDFFFESLNVVVEVMGRRFHDTPERFERDTQRHAELAAIGRVVLPFTFRQVFERPEWVIDQLLRTLAAAA